MSTKARLARLMFVAGSLLSTTGALAYDCNSDCSGGDFSYPCPNVRNPHKMCHGTSPNDPACLSAKEASCQLWDGAVAFALDKVKPSLEMRFNHSTWEAAVANGTTNDYTESCVGDGITVFGLLGTALAGPWGSVVSGSVGTYVAFQLCRDSELW